MFSSAANRLRYRWGPPAVDLVVRLSTFRARRIIGRNAPLRILVDNTILEAAVTHEPAWISKVHSADPQAGYLARVSVYSITDRSRRYRNICYLPGLIALHKMGFVELVTSAELDAERIHQPAVRFGGGRYFDYSLFNGTKMHSIDGFVMPNFGIGAKSPREQQINRIGCRIAGDQMFNRIVKVLGLKNSLDAWHLYTAHQHGVPYFLTMDFEFEKNFKSQAKNRAIAKIQSNVITPEDLGISLKLIPVTPVIYLYHDLSWIAEPGVVLGRRWPSRRRKTETDSRDAS